MGFVWSNLQGHLSITLETSGVELGFSMCELAIVQKLPPPKIFFLYIFMKVSEQFVFFRKHLLFVRQESGGILQTLTSKK